jgi:hypothetical protein
MYLLLTRIVLTLLTLSQTFLNRLLQRGNTAFSTLDLPRYHQDVFDKLFNYYNGAFISIDKNGALNKAQTKREKERYLVLAQTFVLRSLLSALLRFRSSG